MVGERGAMEYDLRHMANQRDAGVSEQNKELLELGWLALRTSSVPRSRAEAALVLACLVEPVYP